MSDDFKSKDVGLIQTHYSDFKPTLAHEKLLEKHKLNLSVESVLADHDSPWALDGEKTAQDGLFIRHVQDAHTMAS